MSDWDVHLSSGDGVLAEFIRALTTTGQVRVASGALLPGDESAVLRVLEEIDAQARQELASGVPAFDPAAARWAAQQFYQACRFLVCRDIPAEEVTRQLDLPCPQPRGPGTDYSVDIVFRFLPQLLQVAERTASNDALTVSLRAWAGSWPLSSVGARVTGPLALDSFLGSPALLRLYADRIVQHAARDRLDDPRVAAQVRADLGAHPDLAPAFASTLLPLSAAASS